MNATHAEGDNLLSSWTGQQTPPVAHVVHVSVGRRGQRTVTVRCPYCERTHVHGWPLNDATPGTRQAHCHDRADGEHRSYRIVSFDAPVREPRRYLR